MTQKLEFETAIPTRLNWANFRSVEMFEKNGASDGARTRDLRRDRPEVYLIKSTANPTFPAMIRGAKATIVGMLFCLIAEPSIAQPADAMVRASAALHDVPVDLALAVSQKESGTSCAAVGRKGERGPLQILPSTARALGYKNIAKASCAQQTDAGMKHLAICYRGMGGNRWAAAACHNQGISAIRHIRPAAKRYADSVMGVPPTRRQRINYLAPAAPRGGL